jgi:hypothetical protein
MAGGVSVLEKNPNGKRNLLRTNHVVPFQHSVLQRAWLTF